MGRLTPVLACLLHAAIAAGAPPPGLVCRGHEPAWSLQLDGSKAAFTTPKGARVTLEGRLQEGAGAKPPFFVFRGKAASGEDLVATITTETCAGAAPGGSGAPYTARVSLTSGELLQGCCAAEAPAPAIATTPPVAAAPAGSPAAAPAPGGEITELSLPDGQVCRSPGKEATAAFGGLRVSFDCGMSGGDREVLVGTLSAGPEGMLQAQKAWIAWRDGDGRSTRRSEPVVARVTAVALSDGLTCRHAGTGATLAFEGRRASYSCGTRDGDTIALLGELEPAEGGFHIVRARLAQGESGFTLHSSETILVAGPR